ncbi:MAG TPA: translation initiation factor IF-3 [Bacteroidota bacterium]|nr:translation initiation factor IF-3 [Bacteroidota bacterium]
MKGSDRVRINEEIRAPKVRVIDDEGQVGVMTPGEALRAAHQRGLDLIEIVPNATPPVCKIMDFGKYKYEQTKKEKLQRKHQQVTLLKELRFHPNTDVHDFDFKTRHARRFLEEGHKLKATVVFKGREITYKEHGEDLLRRLSEQLSDLAKIDQEAKLEGRSMSMIFAPDKGSKKKTETKGNAADAMSVEPKIAEPKIVEPKEITKG